MRSFALFSVFVPVLTFVAFAQTPAPSPFVSVLGTVTSVDADGHVFGVKTDKSGDTTVKFDEKTNFRRIPPGETNIQKATPAKAGDVGVGDRILARVRTENPTGIPANAFYITKQAEIAQRNQKSQDEWKTQSVAGLVKSVDAAAKTATISVRGAGGAARDVVVDFSAASDIKRLNPESLQYESGPATTLRAGDQLRVLGAKNADVTQVKAEAMMYASLRSIPVMIKSIDPATRKITATDLGSKKQIEITLKSDTSMKKLDDATATMLARRLNPSFQGGRGGGAAAPSAGGGRGGGRGGDLNSILDSQPAVNLTDLRPNEPLIVTGAASNDMTKLTATAVVAGVDPILRAAPSNGPDPLGGSWNLGDGPPAQ